MSYLFLIWKFIKKSSLDQFLGTFFWMPIAVDCYHFGSGYKVATVRLLGLTGNCLFGIDGSCLLLASLAGDL